MNLATISPIGDVLFGTQATDDEESMDDLATHIRGIIDDSIPEEEEGIRSSTKPFDNILDFILIAFFDGCNVNISETKIKSI